MDIVKDKILRLRDRMQKYALYGKNHLSVLKEVESVLKEVESVLKECSKIYEEQGAVSPVSMTTNIGNIPIVTPENSPDNPEDITKEELEEHVLDGTEGFVPMGDYKIFVNETEETVTKLSHEFKSEFNSIASRVEILREELLSAVDVFKVDQQKNILEVLDKFQDRILKLENEKYTTCDECTELDREDIYSRLDKLEAKQFRDNVLDVDEYYHEEKPSEPAPVIVVENNKMDLSRVRTAKYIVVITNKNSGEICGIDKTFKHSLGTDILINFDNYVKNTGDTFNKFTLCRIVTERVF
jgi:hypothetical protein